MTKSGSFISSLSSYNQELFHSKAITWLFNNNKDFKKGLLTTICSKYHNKNIEDINIEDSYALSEVNQIDVLIICPLKNGSHYFMHIENKIKASESFKRIDKFTKGYLSEDFINKNKKLSQTEYYYARLHNDVFCKNLCKKLDSKINLNDLKSIENWNFVFLKPSLSLKNKGLDQLNYWRKNISNPWLTFSYEELICKNLIKAKNLNCTATEYKELVIKAFTSVKSENFTKENFLSFENVQHALKEELNLVEKSTLEEWFSLLTHDINEEFNENSPKFHLQSKFVTDTGNNGGFLIEAFYLIPDFQFPKNIGSNLTTAKIGLQYEHSSKSAKMKFFFAAYDYDNIKIPYNLRVKYNEKVKSFLDEENFRYLNKKLTWDDKFNGSKGKSFCSRAVDIKEYKSYKELREIFDEYLKSLSKDLNKINKKVWIEFSQI